MRNLKKILALALALVMTLSLMTVANAFNDDKDIDAKYDEAVTVLSNLKVFKGVNDGSNFAPKQTITRAEVAAIIYRIVTGDVNDTQAGIYKDYAKFKDVAQNHWAAGYIGYCSNAKLIVGDGTNFYPDQTVNGYQALAMILRAMGYDANDEFKGSGWEIRVASTAQQRSLLVNINAGTLGTGASREMVAEILFQAITKNTVVYTPALGYYTSDLIDGVATESLGYKTFGLKQQVGEITAVGRAAGTTTLGSWKTTGTSFWAREVFGNDITVTNTNTPWTNIGYQAYVWTVPTSGAKTVAAVSDVTVTGKSVAVNTAETTTKTIAPLVSTGAAQIATLDDHYNVYYNGMLLPGTQPTNGGYWFDQSKMILKYYDKSTETNVEVVNGLKVDFVDNDNGGKAEAIVFTEYTVASVAGIANENNTGSNAIVRDTYYFTPQSKGNVSRVAVKAANLVTTDTLAVNNLVTYVQYAGDTYVTLAPVTTGAFTQINYSTITRMEESYVIGGTTYVAANVDNNAYWQDYCYDGHAALNRANVGKTMAVYTDPYGYILYVTEQVATNNYLYVVRNNHSSVVDGTSYATVAFADGTVQNVYLSAANYENLNVAAGEMWTYTVDAAGNYVLGKRCTDLANDEMAHAVNIAYQNGSATLVTGDAYVTTGTVVVDLRDVIARRATTATIYTGYNEIPSVTGATFHYVTDSRNFVTLAFLTNGTNTANLAKEFVVFHTNAHYYGVDANGDKFYNLTVISGGELTTVTLTETQYTDVCALGVGFYSYANDGKTLTYKSFETEWVDVAVWADGTVYEVLARDAQGNPTQYGKGYTYNSDVNFWTLDIAAGQAWDYVMTTGVDQKAVIITNNRGQATDIYIVDGTVSSIATANAKYEALPNNDRTTADGDSDDVTYVMDYGTGMTYTFARENGKVTNAIEAQGVQTDAVNSIKVQGVDAKLTGGKGTQADPYTYVAEITAQQKADTSVDLLSVVAKTTSADMKVMGGSFAGTTMGSGSNGTWTYNETPKGMASAPEAYKFFVTVDGVYYTVTCKSVAATFEVGSVADLTAALAEAVDGDTIVMKAGTYELSNLSVSKGVTIQGEGNVIINAASNKNAFYMEVGAGKTATLKGLNLVANGTHAVQMVAHCAGNVVIEDCQFTATGTGYGIYKNAAGNLTVTGCKFVSLPVAIGTDCAWSTLNITSNDFTGCTEALGLTSSSMVATLSDIQSAMTANNSNVNAGMVKSY